LKLSRGKKLRTKLEGLRAAGGAGWYEVQVVLMRPTCTEHIATFMDITAQYTAQQALSDGEIDAYARSCSTLTRSASLSVAGNTTIN
jgi:hypothetical protein